LAPNQADVVLEARILAHYLIDSDPPRELTDRYVAANRLLLTGETTADENASLAFILQHPSALPFLDAAAGLFRRDSLLRKRLLLMTAILEATPLYADFFLSQPRSAASILVIVMWQTILSVLKAALGIPLLWIVEKP
jgi:hypothetical protein